MAVHGARQLHDARQAGTDWRLSDQSHLVERALKERAKAIALLGLVGAAVVVLVVARMRVHPTARRKVPATAPASAVQLARLEAELGSLREDVARLRRASQFGNKAMPSAFTPAAEPEPPAATGAEEAIEQREPAEQLAVMQEVRASEAPDAGWARRKEADISVAFDKLRTAGTRLLSVGCRASVCRFEYEHDDDSARSRFRPAMLADPAFNNADTFFLATDERALHFVSFVSRDGMPLPAPPRD
jgi:hypothetical protein